MVLFSLSCILDVYLITVCIKKKEKKIFATYDTYQTDYNLDGDAFGNVILNNLEEMARQSCVLIMYMCTT